MIELSERAVEVQSRKRNERIIILNHEACGYKVISCDSEELAPRSLPRNRHRKENQIYGI